MVRTGKDLTTPLDTRTKMSNNKQKERFSITDITNQDFRKFLNNFNNLPYLGYKSKQVHNEPTEDYSFLTKQITKLMKTKRHVKSNFVKSIVSEKIGHVNKKIGPVNKTIGHWGGEISSR